MCTETSTFNALRALDGSEVLLCLESQANAVTRGRLVGSDMDEFGGIAVTIEFPAPLGRVMLPANVIALPGDTPPFFNMTAPAAWLPSHSRAKWCLATVWLDWGLDVFLGDAKGADFP